MWYTLFQGDKKSTGGLHCHTKASWGEETVKAAINTKDLGTTCTILAKDTPRDENMYNSSFRTDWKRESKLFALLAHIHGNKVQMAYLFLYLALIRVYACLIVPR